MSSHHGNNRLTIFIDGASSGNPGPSGIGVIIKRNVRLGGRADEETLVKKEGKFIGNATNNVAEYEALLLGLKEAYKLGCKELVINTDSQLLARQLNGDYKIKSDNLIPLYREAKNLISNFNKVVVNDVRREVNREADKLARHAVKEGIRAGQMVA